MSRTPEILDRGVTAIQIREKDLGGRALYGLTCSLLRLTAGTGVAVLVNSRLDVALATGAAGVHLPSGSPLPDSLRPVCPSGFQIGVSCHSVDEVVAAERGGADYVLFSPVFASPGKGEPVGLSLLREAAGAVRTPLIALGGITESRAADCVRAGAAGVAGIRLFQDC